MNPIAQSVSLHPYFKVHPGKMDAAKALLPEFIACTASEKEMLYYEFTISVDVIFCREAYASAAGVLQHLANVGEVLVRVLALSDVIRLEVHGPAAELEKLKGPLAAYRPDWFIYECGVVR